MIRGHGTPNGPTTHCRPHCSIGGSGLAAMVIEVRREIASSARAWGSNCSLLPNGGPRSCGHELAARADRGRPQLDCRYAWIRDASIAIATLSVLGHIESAERYLRWLSRLDSATEM